MPTMQSECSNGEEDEVMQASPKEKIEALEKEVERLKRENDQLKKELAEVNRVAQWALKKVYGGG